SSIEVGCLNDHVGYFVRRLQVFVFNDFIKTLSPLDIRPGQYAVLVVISANAGRSQADIGRALNIERAGLAKMLHGLERRGWVQRLPAIKDGRTNSLFLTPDGNVALRKIRKLAARHEARMTQVLGKSNRDQLIKLLSGRVELMTTPV